MNKTSVIIYTILLVFLLTSCSKIVDWQKQRPGKENNLEGSYKDGTYTEEGDIWKYGNENATVIISNGSIAGITLRKLDSIGKEVNYEDWSSENIKSEGKPNLKKYRVDMAQEMLNEQTYDVEAVSGATISSENWKKAVQKALAKARR